LCPFHLNQTIHRRFRWSWCLFSWLPMSSLHDFGIVHAFVSLLHVLKSNHVFILCFFIFIWLWFNDYFVELSERVFYAPSHHKSSFPFVCYHQWLGLLLGNPMALMILGKLVILFYKFRFKVLKGGWKKGIFLLN
jgi:hypothetical protein